MEPVVLTESKELEASHTSPNIKLHYFNGHINIPNVDPNTNQRNEIHTHTGSVKIFVRLGHIIHCNERTSICGPTENIMLFEKGVIIGKIVNENNSITNIYIGKSVKFFDQNSLKNSLKNPKKNHNIKYLKANLTKDTAEKHLVGPFHIVHFDDDIDSIRKNKDNIPLVIKDFVLKTIYQHKLNKISNTFIL